MHVCARTCGVVHVCTQDVHVSGVHLVSMYMCVARVCMAMYTSVRISLMQVSKYNCSTHHCFNSETPQKPTSQGEKLAGRPRAGQGRCLQLLVRELRPLGPGSPSLALDLLSPTPEAEGLITPRNAMISDFRPKRNQVGEPRAWAAFSHPPSSAELSFPLGSPGGLPQPLHPVFAFKGFPIFEAHQFCEPESFFLGPHMGPGSGLQCPPSFPEAGWAGAGQSKPWHRARSWGTIKEAQLLGHVPNRPPQTTPSSATASRPLHPRTPTSFLPSTGTCLSLLGPGGLRHPRTPRLPPTLHQELRQQRLTPLPLLTLEKSEKPRGPGTV